MVKAQQNPTTSVTQGRPIPPVRLGSPRTSSSKPKSSKSKSAQSKPKAKPKSSSDELIQMAKLLMAQAKSQIEDETSEESSSSEASTNDDPYRPQFQDAQDPYA
ncbi:hypothetical protein ACSBR1_029497 [Camellia fascicularis]